MVEQAYCKFVLGEGSQFLSQGCCRPTKKIAANTKGERYPPGVQTKKGKTSKDPKMQICTLAKQETQTQSVVGGSTNQQIAGVELVAKKIILLVQKKKLKGT